MNTLQIERLLKKDLKSKTIFKKVCALDQLEKPTFPSAYVINWTRVVNLENIGLRFILTSMVEENISTVMDYPYIGWPQVLHGSLLLMGWIYNRKTLQAYFSSFCGHYCLCFILFRCRGVPLHAIVSDFMSKLTENDHSTSRFIRDVSQH